MDRDELKDAIEGTLEHTCCENFETQATSILSLIAPELDKALKFDQIAKAYNASDDGVVRNFNAIQALRHALTEKEPT